MNGVQAWNDLCLRSGEGRVGSGSLRAVKAHSNAKGKTVWAGAVGGVLPDRDVFACACRLTGREPL